MRGYSRPAPAPCPQGTQTGCSPALCVALCWRLNLPLPSICELVFISPEAPFLGVDVGEGRETPNPPGHHGQTQPPASLPPPPGSRRSVLTFRTLCPLRPLFLQLCSAWQAACQAARGSFLSFSLHSLSCWFSLTWHCFP